MKRGWRSGPISEFCDVNPRRPRDLHLDSATEVTFVPMAAIDERFGRICEPEVKPFDDVRSGFTYFAEGDVLFSKITPCMQNGKSAIAEELVNGVGFGSTEFHVLRPKNGDLLPRWVWHFVRQRSFRRDAKRSFRGSAGQQRVPAAFLSDYQIAVPPVSEQDRILKTIASFIDRAHECLDLHQKRLDDLIELRRSLVLGTSPADRQWGRVGDFMEHIPETLPVVEGETYEFAGVKSFGRGVFHSGSRHTDEFKYRRLRRLSRDDFIYPKLMAWEGGLGIVTRHHEGMVVSPEFVVFKSKNNGLSPLVVDTYFRSPLCLASVRAASTGSNKRRRRLHPDAFLELKVPIPSPADQAHLLAVCELEATVMAESDRLRTDVADATESLLRKAFSGEL